MDVRLFLVAALALPAAPALAQTAAETASASDTVRVLASAQPGCVIGAASARGGSNASFTPDGNGGGRIVIAELVDPQTAQPRASHVEIALPATCNAAHRLIIASEAGGLLRAGGRANGRARADQFGDLLPYAIRFDWGGNGATMSSDRARVAPVQSAAQGELLLQIETTASSDLLNAGQYNDIIVIRFEPGN